MTLNFYLSTYDPRNVSKTLTGMEAVIDADANTSLSGTFRDATNTFDPVVAVEMDAAYMFNFNYVEIVEWSRYYFVRERRVLLHGLIELQLEEDTLNTWSAWLLLFPGHVSRTESNLKPFLPDGMRPISRNVSRSVILPDSSHRDIFDVSNISVSESIDPTIVLSVANPGLGSLIRPYSVDSSHPTSDWAVDADPITTAQAAITFMYALTVDQLMAFYSYLNTTDWANNTAVSRLLLGHGAEGITGVVAYPFRLADTALASSKYHIVKNPGTTKHIYMFGEDTGCDAYLTYQNSNPIIDFGGFKYKDAATSFLDYEPYTTCQMYLPYCGTVDIPMAVMANGGITLKYMIDLATGSCQAILKGSTPDAYVKVVTGQIGVNVPILNSNANEHTIKRLHSLENVLQGMGSMVGGIAMTAAGGNGTGMLISGVKQTASGIHQMIYNPLTMSTTIPESSLGRALYCDPYCLISSVVDETPANYGHYVGYPYDQIVTALNTLSGRCVVDEIFGTFSDASEREMDDIRAKLRAGVIF